MNDSEKQIRDALANAFDEIHAPEDLKSRTLQAIEAQRAQECEARKTKRFRLVTSLRARIALAACAVLVALGIGAGAFAYNTPTAYVGIDINPSIELGINCFDYVVSAEGLNDDGKTLLDATNVTGMRYEEALQSLDTSLQAEGYLTPDAAVAVTVMCDDEGRCTHLEETSKRCFESAGQGVHCSRATSDEHHAAHGMGLGMGKYQVWCALVDAGVDISPDEAASMTMAQIRSLAADAGVDLNQVISQNSSEEEASDHSSSSNSDDASVTDNASASASESSEYHGGHQRARQGGAHHDE